METFEEFKRNFEIFRKIDTPEVLAICEKQYRSYVLQVEDANYFEPSEEPSSKSDIGSVYERNIRKMFSVDFEDCTEAYCLVLPSFEPEYLLSIKKEPAHYTLTYAILATSYWLKFYDNPEILSVDKISKKVTILRDTGDKLMFLFDLVFREARTPKVTMMVLDGVTYYLSKVVAGVRKEVFKNPSGEDSKAGKVIGFLEQIMSLVNQDESDDLDSAIDSALTEVQKEMAKF